jgi:Flp pilus assembly protein TadD
MELRRVCILIASLGFAFVGTGCERRHPGPYSSSTAKDAIVRDSAAAQKLFTKAAECQESDPLDAEDLLRQALDADLYHGMAHNNLGVLLLNRGEIYAAVQEFEWARKLLPGHPKPRVNLAIALHQADKHT